MDATDTNEQSLTITEIINHPQYVDATSANDIAILKVSGTFTCATDKIYPACLPSTNVSVKQLIFYNTLTLLKAGTMCSTQTPPT